MSNTPHLVPTDLEQARKKLNVSRQIWASADRRDPAFAAGLVVAFDRDGCAILSHPSPSPETRAHLAALRAELGTVMRGDQHPRPSRRERRGGGAPARSAPGIRDAATDGALLRGYAVVYPPAQSVDLGGFFEMISPAALEHDLRTGKDVLAVDSHDWSKVLARVSNSTLTLRSDPHGLAVSIRVPPTSVGQAVATLVRLGTISGMSFAFTVLAEEWARGATLPVRTVTSLSLHEVSVVARPAHLGTEISAWSIDVLAREIKQMQAQWIFSELEKKYGRVAR